MIYGNVDISPTHDAQYDNCNKPHAKPIEIPSRRNSLAIGITSIASPTGPLSPDLIFEMSPITSDSTSAHYSFSFSASHEHGPFMYQFPVLSTHHVNCERQHSTSQTHRDIGIAATALADTTYPVERKVVSDHKAARTARASVLDSMNSLRLPPVTKITGFAAMEKTLPPMSNSAPRSSIKLTPPPRSSSYSSSPWILPGKTNNWDDDNAYSQTDPSIFAFEKHLFQRMDAS